MQTLVYNTFEILDSTNTTLKHFTSRLKVILLRFRSHSVEMYCSVVYFNLDYYDFIIRIELLLLIINDIIKGVVETDI